MFSVQKCRNAGCVNKSRTRARVRQPSPHIFLHICIITKIYCTVSQVSHGSFAPSDQRWQQRQLPTAHPHHDFPGASRTTGERVFPPLCLDATKVWLPDGYSQIFRLYVFGPSGFWTMAPLLYATKFDPFLSLDCAPTPSTLAQSKERKAFNFAV